MTTPIRTTAALAAGLATTILAAPTTAQDALGSGRALDASLQQGSGGLNRPGGRIDFAARNNLITNNVVGGRGFRDTVGYGAIGDFSVDIDDINDGTGLGSNDIFPFLADSAISSVGALSLGGTYERVRYGQELGLIDIQRPGASRLAGDFAGGPMEAPTGDLDLIMQYSRMQRDLTADRLTRGQQLTQRYEWSVEGNAIGVTRNDVDGQAQFSAVRPDSLKGVNFVPFSQDFGQLGLSPFDTARRRFEVEAGLVPAEMDRQFEGRYEGLNFTVESAIPGAEAGEAADTTDSSRRVPRSIGSRLDSGLVRDRIASDPYAEFKRIQEAVAQRFGTTDDPGTDTAALDLAGVEAEIEELRALLAPHLARAASGEERERSETERILDPEGIVPDPDADPRVLIPEGGGGATRATMNESTLTRVSNLLAHGRSVEHFAPNDPTRFGELMRDGESALARGSYFEAERKFERARSQAPGHPLAAAGLIHARIGAELYPGAATELRTLLAERPEMIDVRYDPALAPAGADLRRAATDLRDRLSRGQDPARLGVLLGYVGRLLQDDAAIGEGLSAAREASPDDPIVPLLLRLWLDDAE